MKTYTRLSLVFWLWAFALHARAQDPVGLHIELHIFSGRENPTFMVSDEKHVREILDLVKASKKDAASTKVDIRPARTGYTGFTLENLSKIEPGIQGVTVYRSEMDVKLMGADSKIVREVRIDTERMLETKLIELLELQKVVPPELMEYIKTGKHLGKSPKGSPH